MGYGKERLGVGFAEKLIFNACVKSFYFSLKEGRYEKSIFHYVGFGPGGETSIPPVPVPKSTQPHFGISTQFCPTSQHPSSGFYSNQHTPTKLPKS